MSRIFILGNGPSLLEQQPLLRHLAAEDTFCCNRMSSWQGLPFRPTYYACSANAVLKGVEPRDPPYVKQRFMVSRRRDQLEGWERWTPVYKKEWFDLLAPGAPELNVRGGATMPGIMVQLAVWLGYQELYLLGIEQRGSGHIFDPAGQGDYRYFIPDEETLFATWRLIKETYEARGVRLRDCTPEGRLNGVLGYQPLEDVLALVRTV